MYNRYIRGDSGAYTRISEDEPRSQPPPSPSFSSDPPPRQEPPPSSGGGFFEARSAPPPPGEDRDGISHLLRKVLDQLHLDHIDTGDLLLLGLLFFLFREGADDELLVALGLLLIL